MAQQNNQNQKQGSNQDTQRQGQQQGGGMQQPNKGQDSEKKQGQWPENGYDRKQDKNFGRDQNDVRQSDRSSSNSRQRDQN